MYVFVKRVPGSMCGDGVVIRLVVDGQLAYERAMPLGLEDKTLQDDVAEFEVEVPMDIGSTLELQVDPRKSHDCDGMLVDLKIMNVADQGSIDEI